MTSPLSAVGAIGGVGGVSGVGGVGGASSSTAAASSTSGSDFAAQLGHGLDAVNDAQQHADSLAVQAATGGSVDPAALTVAMTQATVMTQLASAVQSKAIAAFNTIMGMQA